MKLKVALVLVITITLAVLFATQFFNLQVHLESALQWISHLGFWAPAIFIALYALACVLFVPGSVLTLGAGFLFGIVKGSVCVSIASVIGATLCFLLGRHVARDWVARKIAGNTVFAAVDEAVAREGWKVVILTRLSPVFPFNLLNYAFGITRVSLRDYVLASWLGMLPGTMVYVYLGSIAGDLASLGASAITRTPMEWALYGVGFIATLSVTIFVTRAARAALRERGAG